MFIWRNINAPGGDSLPAKRPRALPASYQKAETKRDVLKGVVLKEKVTPRSISRAIGQQATENFCTVIRNKNIMEGALTPEETDKLYEQWKAQYEGQLLAALDIDGPFDTTKLPEDALPNYLRTLQFVKGIMNEDSSLN